MVLAAEFPPEAFLLCYPKSQGKIRHLSRFLDRRLMPFRPRLWPWASTPGTRCNAAYYNQRNRESSRCERLNSSLPHWKLAGNPRGRYRANYEAGASCTLLIPALREPQKHLVTLENEACIQCKVSTEGQTFQSGGCIYTPSYAPFCRGCGELRIQAFGGLRGDI